MNAKFILPEFEQSPRTLPRRRKMNVRQLADRMTQRIIDLPQRPIAPMHMSDGNLRNVRRRRGRKGFHSVADNQNDVRSQLLKGSCERGDGLAGGVGG